MYAGDRSRKDTLVEFGFRLPSAVDNRPLKFAEFDERIGLRIYTSATPGHYEFEHSCPQATPKTTGAGETKMPHADWVKGFDLKVCLESGAVVEQIIRPTGLVDPEIDLRKVTQVGEYPGQIKDFIAEAERVIAGGGRVLTTTLTKKMAEDLAEFLTERKINTKYIHSDIKTIERIEILTDFRRGKFDCLVGVNLLREGLDLPEVELVAILDADKEGFLRSETALIQTIGRAARNVRGRVVLYADEMTKALTAAHVDTLELKNGKKIDWRRDVAMKLLNLQQKDGSWANDNARWWEKDPALVTAYAVVTLSLLHRGL